MVRVFLAAIAICLIAGTFPASTQGGGGCDAWCRANRCSGGYVSGNAPKCMINCVAACQKKHSK
jgi:hypothetical protein